jgi:hypothetical protein
MKRYTYTYTQAVHEIDGIMLNAGLLSNPNKAVTDATLWLSQASVDPCHLRELLVHIRRVYNDIPSDLRV